MSKNTRKRSILKIKNKSSWNRSNYHRRLDVEHKIGKSGHVYVFSLGYDDLYKIGKTTNLKSRQASLKASNPRLRYVWSAYSKNHNALEKLIHIKMDNYWVEREIFRFKSYSCILEINKIADEYNLSLTT